MIFEIRDYHYRRDIFDEYKRWAEELAVPVLKKHMDILGFWIDSGEEPEITGTDPFESPIGVAHVTWIIRWESRAARDAGFAKLLAADDWKDVWAKHPDANGYLQMQGRFMDAV